VAACQGATGAKGTRKERKRPSIPPTGQGDYASSSASFSPRPPAFAPRLRRLRLLRYMAVRIVPVWGV